MSAGVGRPSTPPALHLLRNDPSKLGAKRIGALLDEAVRPPVAIPKPPVELTQDALEEWNRITPHLAQLGLISHIDRAALTGYCVAWGDFIWAERRIKQLNARGGVIVFDAKGRKRPAAADKNGDRGRIWDTPSGYKQISVPMQIRNRALELMAKFLNEFGLSPAARTRVTPSDPAVAGNQGELPGITPKPQEAGWGNFTVKPPESQIT